MMARDTRVRSSVAAEVCKRQSLFCRMGNDVDVSFTREAKLTQARYMGSVMGWQYCLLQPLAGQADHLFQTLKSGLLGR